MRTWARALGIGTVTLAAALTSHAVNPGDAAPAFTLADVEGKAHSLADHAGKIVVLEWTNYECPFVKKHYDSKNMQKLQKTYTDKGVVWLSVCSSAAGKQGNFTQDVWRERMAKGGVSTPVLLDPDGAVGKAYGAKTTPHMFVVDAAGKIAYAGAIDDNPSFDPKTIEGARNFVAAALDALLQGKPVEAASSKPYGCSVKY